MTYRNQFLNRLAPDDLAALEPHLTRMQTRKGEVLIQQGAVIQDVHFPESGDLSNIITFSDGSAADTAVVGMEGVTGLAPMLAEAPCAWSVVVQTPGVVHRLPARILVERSRVSPRLQGQLILLTHDYQSQAAQSAACNALHAATARLARWLLLMADRTPGDRLTVTQEDLGHLLGMARTTITQSAQTLKRTGAIAYTRGAVRIVDRRRLEGLACECYRMQRERSREIGLDIV